MFESLAGGRGTASLMLQDLAQLVEHALEKLAAGPTPRAAPDKAQQHNVARVLVVLRRCVVLRRRCAVLLARWMVLFRVGWEKSRDCARAQRRLACARDASHHHRPRAALAAVRSPRKARQPLELGDAPDEAAGFRAAEKGVMQRFRLEGGQLGRASQAACQRLQQHARAQRTTHVDSQGQTTVRATLPRCSSGPRHRRTPPCTCVDTVKRRGNNRPNTCLPTSCARRPLARTPPQPTALGTLCGGLAGQAHSAWPADTRVSAADSACVAARSCSAFRVCG